MSGIVGIYNLNGRPVERTEIQRMLGSIAHRGPDGSGIWTDGPVGLGHRMLWTTPESLQEKLPLTSKSGDLVITADARIDNREELIPTLDLNGRPRETITDSEIILAAYEKWGEKCPEKLLGDFAFAIWDKGRQIVFCARDHFGVKPFYYHRSEKILAFASEIKGILHVSDVPRRLNELAVGYFLARIVEDKAITFYEGILRLPPGQTMTIDHGKISINSYWSLDPTRKLKLGSNDEYAEAFREIFKEAVRCRLRSAFPVGSMLSGGLDSSSIVCMARRLLSQNGNNQFHTFSWVFDNVFECDERFYIDKVLAQGDLHSHYIHADKISPLADLDRVFSHEDEPFLGPNLFMTWNLYGTAKKTGVRVLLDGEDGDTTVSYGIAFLRELARSKQWSALMTEVKELAKRLDRSQRRIIWNQVIKPITPQIVRRTWQSLRRLSKPSWAENTIINPGFAEHLNLQFHIHKLDEKWSTPAITEQEDHWRGLTSGIIPYTFDWVDRAANAFYLEPRYPFFDKRLAEFCLALPPEQKLNHGWTRMVMRRAMASILPTEIQWRNWKSDLSPNFTYCLLTFEKEHLEDLFRNNSQILKPYVNLIALRKVFCRYLEQKMGNDAFTVWIAVTLALWLLHTAPSIGNDVMVRNN